LITLFVCFSFNSEGL